MSIDDFLAHLKLRGYSPSTTLAYRRELLRFHNYLKTKRLRITQVRAKTVLDYFETEATRNLDWTTLSRKYAVLSTFFDYLSLVTDGRIKNPVKLIRRPRRQQPKPDCASEEVLDRLAAGMTSKRDRAILALFRSSGLRLNELASLDRESIQIEETALPFGARRILGVGRVVGKGGKEREFLIDLKTVGLIHDYLRERGDDGLTPLFLSNRKQRISARTIEAMLVSWCRRLGVPELHPHAIRHAAATHWYRLGMDTLQIRDLLGHSSVTTTNLYVHPDSARLRAAYFAALESTSTAAESPKPIQAG